MTNLNDLDQITTKIAAIVYRSAPSTDWSTAEMTAKFSPSGVGQFQYEYRNEARLIDESANPDLAQTDELLLLVMEHWRLAKEMGSARWYAMKVLVDRSGKFNVNFEYKDDYQEGDVMRD